MSSWIYMYVSIIEKSLCLKFLTNIHFSVYLLIRQSEVIRTEEPTILCQKIFLCWISISPAVFPDYEFFFTFSLINMAFIPIMNSSNVYILEYKVSRSYHFLELANYKYFRKKRNLPKLTLHKRHIQCTSYMYGYISIQGLKPCWIKHV